jgi:hypothetical protein
MKQKLKIDVLCHHEEGCVHDKKYKEAAVEE